MTATLLLRGLLAGICLLVIVKATSLIGSWPGLPARIVAEMGPGTAHASTAPGAQAGNTAPAAALASAPASAPATAGANTDSMEANAALAATLRARREALDERERALAMREAVIAAAERRLNARIEELAALQARLERDTAQSRERDEAHWRGLAKLYESMRPREAAAVLNELDMPVLVQLMDRMGERKAAPILGAMQPERVRLLTVELARQRAARPGNDTSPERPRP